MKNSVRNIDIKRKNYKVMLCSKSVVHSFFDKFTPYKIEISKTEAL